MIHSINRANEIMNGQNHIWHKLTDSTKIELIELYNTTGGRVEFIDFMEIVQRALIGIITDISVALEGVTL